MKPAARRAPEEPGGAKVALLVGEAPDWQPELRTRLTNEGYASDTVAQLDAVLPMLAGGVVRAVFLGAGPRAASDLLLLRRIREASPSTAVVVVTKRPTDPDLKRAFESGATAFLSWPASNDALRHALDPGGMSEDGRLLARLAGLDQLVLVRDAEWRRLAQRLDALRREIAVTTAEIQRSRSLAARKASRDDYDGERANSPPPPREEARTSQLMLEFETALRQAEERRVSFHAEMDDLRRRRRALLERLPASVSLAYQSRADADLLPVIAAVLTGACGGCESALPESVLEALDHGAVAVCARCERLLHRPRRFE